MYTPDSESPFQLRERFGRLFRPLGRAPLREAIDGEPAIDRVEYPIVERTGLNETVLHQLESGDRSGLAGIVREKLMLLGLNEDDLVFRAFAHPEGNITEEVLARYGTDRFHGYGPGRLPQVADDLIPFKNQGETVALTADTYVVPDLEWALAFTKLTVPRGAQDFREGRIDPYLVAYHSSGVHIKQTPGDMGGEQWRGVFLTTPTEALATVIHFVR